MAGKIRVIKLADFGVSSYCHVKHHGLWIGEGQIYTKQFPKDYRKLILHDSSRILLLDVFGLLESHVYIYIYIHNCIYIYTCGIVAYIYIHIVYTERVKVTFVCA